MGKDSAKLTNLMEALNKAAQFWVFKVGKYTY
jgi:hypothetical protein